MMTLLAAGVEAASEWKDLLFPLLAALATAGATQAPKIATKLRERWEAQLTSEELERENAKRAARDATQLAIETLQGQVRDQRRTIKLLRQELAHYRPLRQEEEQ